MAMLNSKHSQVRRFLTFASLACLAVAGFGGCLPGSDPFVVMPEDGDSGAGARDGGVPEVRDAGRSTDHVDGAAPSDGGSTGGPLPAHCELPPTCADECERPFLLTTLNVPGCNGVVLRHAMSRAGACLCESHSNFFESEATDALFIAPDTLLVVGEGHLANRNMTTGENRWVHPFDTTARRTLEPTSNEEQIYVIGGERSEGPITIHDLGDGAQLRFIDTSLANLTSLVVDHRDKQVLVGISEDGKLQRFDTQTRGTSEHRYHEGDRNQPIVQVSTAYTTPGYPLHVTAIHENNTLSTTVNGAPEFLEGCTSDPTFHAATAFDPSTTPTMITVEESAGNTGVYMRTYSGCSAVLLPSDFPSFRVRRTRPQL